MKNRQIFSDTISRSAPPLSGILQRKCACGQHTVAGGGCADCEKKGLLQRSATSTETSIEVVPMVHEVLQSPGHPLNAATRAFMEPRFGHFNNMASFANASAPTPSRLTVGDPHDRLEREAEMITEGLDRSSASTGAGFDFSGVRIHADAKANQSVESLNALAYTVGQHIVFGEGQYQPNTADGRKLMAHELTHVAQQMAQAPGLISRQPSGGWSGAKGHNKSVTTVDAQGNIQKGKLATDGVWRVPLEGLTHGLQKGDKGPAIESSEKKAIVLIPNTMTPATSADKADKEVPVDVLLHLHGFGVGYRELKPGKVAKELNPGELRDVDLYQMEQQLLSHVTSSNRVIIAILPQGTERSDFGDLRSKHDLYLKDVFSKLIPTFLPQGAVPGRLILSAHSGGGPSAMAIAAQRSSNRTDVLLFDAINFGCTDKQVKMKDGKAVVDKQGNEVTECKPKSPCASNEYKTVSSWVTAHINADVNSLSGTPPDQKTQLQTSGTRFRGFTSSSLKTTDTCSYGFWYNKLKNDIAQAIAKPNLKSDVTNQLLQNYRVVEVSSVHERVMGQGNLEAALKD